MISKPLTSLLLCTSLLALSGCGAVAVSGAAATGFAVAHDRRTAGTMVDDKSIELKAIHALSKHKRLWNESHISVVSYNNVVLLVGQTPTAELKHQAEQVIRRIPNIHQLYNEIVVSPPISMLARSNDTWITTQIKTRLVADKNIRANRIKVVTEDAIVYLMGIVEPREERIAVDIARSTVGVKKVVEVFEQPVFERSS